MYQIIDLDYSELDIATDIISFSSKSYDIDIKLLSPCSASLSVLKKEFSINPRQISIVYQSFGTESESCLNSY